MQLLRVSLFACVASATTLATRSAQAVNDGITGIDVAVRNLTQAVSAYNGGVLESQPFLDASIAVHNINRIATADAKASSRFTSAQSKAIVKNTQQSVGVSIPESVKVLMSKKDLFEEAQIRGIVLAFVNLLKFDHETFSLQVGKLLSLDQAVPGAAAAGKIDAVLQEAALFFTV